MLSDESIEIAYLQGQRAWPMLPAAWHRFTEAVLAAAPSEAKLLEHAADLYLASAACAGDAQALQIIDRDHIAPLRRRLRPFSSPTSSVDDVLQIVRQRLFTGAPPRIAAYAPTAPLRQWIRVVAVRAAIDHQRAERSRRAPADLLAEGGVRPAGADAATVAMKRQYKAELEAALRSNLALLAQRDRAILRLHLVDNVSVEKIAVMYGVHRITVARWIWKAGEELLEGLRAHFRDRFRVLPPELDSLAALLQSEISLDLPRLL
jgi:RNA polymerase sigma-70 factor (ECF subfamily)